MENLLSFTRRESLTGTFRFGDGILRSSTQFVQQNPERTKRTLTTHSQDGDQGINVIPSDLPEAGLYQALREMEEIRDPARESVTVLGRYRSSGSALGRHRGRIRNLEFNTIRSSKVTCPQWLKA